MKNPVFSSDIGRLYVITLRLFLFFLGEGLILPAMRVDDVRKDPGFYHPNQSGICHSVFLQLLGETRS